MFSTANRLLVCLHYGIGDVVMQMPVLDALKSTFANKRITLLGAQPALELFADDPAWQMVQSIQQWGLKHLGDEGDPFIQKQIAQWMDRRQFDIIFDPSHAVNAVKAVVWQRKSAFLDTQPQLAASACNGIDAIKAAVREGWGLAVPSETSPRLWLNHERLQAADRYMRPQLRLFKGVLGISAVASSALKRWPVERLAQVAERLAHRLGWQVLVFSGPRQQFAQELASCMRRPPLMMTEGVLHLLDTAALLGHCALLICNDTGLMHLAGAMGTPMLAIFGPTAARIYLPAGSNARAVSSKVACPHRLQDRFGPSPCLTAGRCLLGSGSCINSITASEVLQAAEALVTDTTGEKNAIG